MHHWFIPANALGAVCAVGYAGYATTPSHIPWGGYAATLLFFAAAAIPVISAFRSIGTGFVDIESEYLTNRQREHNPPKQEVIGPEPASAQFISRRRRSYRFMYVLTALALILLISDISYRYSHLPAGATASDHITNF